MLSLQGQIDRLYRRVLMMVAPAQITATDDTGLIHLAQIGISNTPEIIDSVPVTHYYGFHTNPPVKTDAIVIFHAGLRAQPVIVGHNHTPSRPKNFKPGEMAIYTDEGQTPGASNSFKFARGEAATLLAGQSFTLTTKAATLTGSTTLKLDSPTTSTTGKLVLAQDPAGAMEAGTKQYIDRGDGARDEQLAALEARIAALEARAA